MPVAFFAAIGFGSAIAGQVIFSIGLSIGFGFISRALSPKFKPDKEPRPMDALLQSDAPRQWVRGQKIVSGVEIYRAMRDGAGDDKWMDKVFAIAGHEIAKYRQVYIDVGNGQETISLDGYLTSNVGAGSGQPVAATWFDGRLAFEFRSGTDPQTALGSLVTNQPTDWTADHQGVGVALVYVQIKYSDTERFPNGIPAFGFDILGKPLYDPRTSLVGYDEDTICNPALNVRDHLLTARKDGGLGFSEDEIQDAEVIAAANICDEDVDLADGGTQKRYKLGWTANFGRDQNQDIDELLDAMAGFIVTAGGVRIHAGAWTASVLTLTDDDLVAPIEFQSLASGREWANTIKGTFSGFLNNEKDDYPPVSNPAYVTLDDGIVLVEDFPLPAIDDPIRAQRLARIRLEEIRHSGIVKFSAKLKAWQLVPGDVFSLTHKPFVDAAAWPEEKKFQVLETKLVHEYQDDGTPLIKVAITAKETEASIWSWTSIMEKYQQASEEEEEEEPEGPAVLMSSLTEPNGSQYAEYSGASSNLSVAGNFDGAGEFQDRSNNMRAENVSREPVSGLLYSGATTKTWVCSVPWWDVPAVSGHIQNGLVSNDQAQMDKEVQEYQARQFYGAWPTWYGAGRTDKLATHNAATLKLKNACETYSCPFWLLYEHLAFQVADPTQQIKDDLVYADDNYFTSAMYYKEGGRPLFSFFGDELVSGINWNEIATWAAANLTYNPILMFRNTGGLVRGSPNISGGAISWLDPTAANKDVDGGMSYLDDFYSYMQANAAGKIVMGSAYPGFDQSLAAWDEGHTIPRLAGQTWLNCFAQPALNGYGAGDQLPHMGIATLNDYEEGTAIETGISGAMTPAGSMAGSLLSWTIPGANEAAYVRYEIYHSEDDGVTGTLFGTVDVGDPRELSMVGLASGTHKLYIRGIGKCSVINVMSSAVAYTN